MNVYSAFNPAPTVSAPSGDSLWPEYGLVREDDSDSVSGKREVVGVTGHTDMYAVIQSHRDETSVSSLLARFLRGDTQALDQRKGVFADLSALDGLNLANAYDVIQDARGQFNKLTAEQRAIFGGDFREFLATAPDKIVQGLKDLEDAKKADQEAPVKAAADVKE